MISRSSIVGLLVLIAIVMSPGASQGAPKADLWPLWANHDATSAKRVDHTAWDRFLKDHVVESGDGVNRISYAAVGPSDRDALSAYIGSLSAFAVSTLNRGEQMAYWINLYNALTVQVILDHYPVTSIRKINISPGIFSSGPWGKKLVTVEGENVSLDDIEHRILRPVWRDARIHYAVNCASIGCPNLLPRAFSADDMELLLDEAARNFVNHPRGARVEGGKLYVSSIYEWFKADFGGTDQGVIDHLGKFAAPGLGGHLKGLSAVADDHYDWSLNEAKP